MTDSPVPYPPAPANVPPDFTKPTTSYRARVLIVLASLWLFACLYVGLVVGSAYFCYWCFTSGGRSEPVSPMAQKALYEASSTNQRLFTVFNQALAKLKQGAINTDGFLDVLEREILPPWRAQRLSLGQLQGLPRQQQRLIDKCAGAFKEQERSFELLAQAIRANDDRLTEQSRQKEQQADRLFEQLSGEVNRYQHRSASRNDDSEPWWFVAGILSGLLCLFLVKGFFKWRRGDKAKRMELTEKDQPILFGFIHQVCQDTRAPRPHRVYLTHEVNAAVFYHESLLNLVLPTPKNLLIGLGLVNQLNLSEFKAVLAHEFGHFSQNSMKLGSYVYMSNRVIADLVFGRDWLDDLVAAVRRMDIRIAVFAWAFTGVLWALRKTLQGLFRVINFANSALSRQMEFNADLVAVSVSGSDALVHGLARLDLASEALGQAWSDLSVAADHGLYSTDLFYHQTREVEYLRAQRRDPRLGEPPALPDDPRQTVQVFQPEDTSAPRMWATHPSNYDREVNAKQHYLSSPQDERSPWILFQDAGAVRETITRRLYQLARGSEDLTLQAPEVVQAFIDEEHAATTYDARYQGLYDDRYLTPGDLNELLGSAAPVPASLDSLVEAHAQLYGEALKTRMDGHAARMAEYAKLAPLAHGHVELRAKDFRFRGNRYQAVDAKRLLEDVKKELDQDMAWMGSLDRDAFLLHYDLARHVGEEARCELEGRYRFHLAVQDIHRQLSAQARRVETLLDQLAGQRELNKDDFRGVVTLLRGAHSVLETQLEAAAQLQLPPLKNLQAGEPLRSVLLTTPLLEPLRGSANSLDGAWIGRLLAQLREVLEKVQRVHFKSLGAILTLQERLVEQCLQRKPDAADVTAVEIVG